MSLATRCNANAYSIFGIATLVIPYPNFSITYGLLTKLYGVIFAQGSLSQRSPQRVACVYQPDVMLIAILFLLLLLMLCPAQISVL